MKGIFLLSNSKYQRKSILLDNRIRLFGNWGVCIEIGIL